MYCRPLRVYNTVNSQYCWYCSSRLLSGCILVCLHHGTEVLNTSIQLNDSCHISITPSCISLFFFSSLLFSCLVLPFFFLPFYLTPSYYYDMILFRFRLKKKWIELNFNSDSHCPNPPPPSDLPTYRPLPQIITTRSSAQAPPPTAPPVQPPETTNDPRGRRAGTQVGVGHTGDREATATRGRGASPPPRRARKFGR